MPLYVPTFNDSTDAANLAVELRRIAVDGVPRAASARRGVSDEVSDGAAALANQALTVLRDAGSAGLADWLLMHLSQDPDELYTAMVQRRLTEALLAAGLVAPADRLDTGDLWVETSEHAPAAPVTAPRSVPWAPRQTTDGERVFTARVSSPTEL